MSFTVEGVCCCTFGAFCLDYGKPSSTSVAFALNFDAAIRAEILVFS